MRKILPFAASWPPTSLMPYLLKRCLVSFSLSTGDSTVVIAGEGLFEKSLSPSASIPARAARAIRACRSKTFSRPSSRNICSDSSSPETSAMAGVHAVWFFF